jgi:hypothetical protein
VVGDIPAPIHRDHVGTYQLWINEHVLGVCIAPQAKRVRVFKEEESINARYTKLCMEAFL